MATSSTTISCRWLKRRSQTSDRAAFYLTLRTGETGRCDVGVVPPTAAQSFKQRRRIGIAVRLRLHAIAQGLLIGLLRVDQRQILRLAELDLAPRNIEASR